MDFVWFIGFVIIKNTDFVMDFAKQKANRLNHADLSRKGSVDVAIQDIVNLINSQPMFFTTSSCSGRTIIIENSEGKSKKNGCKWLHVTHGMVQMENIENSLQELTGEAIFKFEPMVMHIQCQTLENARKMHQAAVAAGFRNSGITVGSKGKIIMAVRSTHSLEAPLSSEGKILVSKEYLKYLAASANTKMEENFSRINRFHENLKLLAKEPMLCPTEDRDVKKCRRPAKHLETNHDEESEQRNRNSGTEVSVHSSDNDFSLFMFEDDS